jgi:hypothetical protein
MDNFGGLTRISGWIAVTIGTAIVVFFALVTERTTCVDTVAGYGDSYCTTALMLGTGLAWTIAIVGLAIVIFAIIRIILISRKLAKAKH